MRQLNLVEKIEQVNALQNSNNITQKRYFLIINAESIDKIKRVFEIVNSDLYDAGFLAKKDYAILGNVGMKLRFSEYLPIEKVSEIIFTLSFLQTRLYE